MQPILVRSVLVFGTALLVAACSTAPDKISANYVSPLQYQDYSCRQIGSELMRVNRKVIEVTGAQQDEADGDAGAMAVGLILFWPALFFLAGEDREHELANLKGEYEALETVAIQKDCDIADELRLAQAQRDTYAEKVRKEKEASGSLGEDYDFGGSGSSAKPSSAPPQSTSTTRTVSMQNTMDSDADTVETVRTTMPQDSSDSTSVRTVWDYEARQFGRERCGEQAGYPQFIGFRDHDERFVVPCESGESLVLSCSRYGCTEL